MSNYRVSVVMSTYNESIPVLHEAIDSILKQTYEDFEYIIVLDNPDNADIRNVVNEYSNFDKRIRVLEHKSNQGLVNSLNDGIKIAKGELIARMDADDIADLLMLEKEISVMDEKNLDLVSASKINFTSGGTVTGEYINEMNELKIKKLLPFGNPITHPSVLVKKEIIENLNGYRNIDACEDYDLWTRMAAQGYKMQILPDTLIQVRIRKDSVTRTDNYRQYVSERFIRKEIGIFNKTGNFLTEEEYIEYKEKCYKNEKSGSSFNRAYVKMYDGFRKIQEKKILDAIVSILRSLFLDKRMFVVFKNKVMFGLIKRYG